MVDLPGFRRAALTWFRRNARDLPWRRTRDPYAVWISEVMLQQTQVATAAPYWRRFLERFPDVHALAAAEERDVLRLWEGLGYYRRARQLHAAAKRLAADHGGELPSDVDSLRRLPGFGRYTASAIASIAYDRREPIVEANTLRLYCRLLAYRGDPHSSKGVEPLWKAAATWLPRRGSGEFNQALMELGSLVCKPRQPLCDQCPVVAYCEARRLGLVDQIPRPKAPPRRQRVAEAAILVRRSDRVLIVERAAGERWAGMWDFPRLTATTARMPRPAARLSEMLAERFGLRDIEPAPLARLRYSVTRFQIELQVFEASVARAQRLPTRSGGRWAELDELASVPLSMTGRKMARLVGGAES